MPTSRRAVALSLAAVVLTGTLPAYAGPGPVPLDTKDSYVAARAFEMSSSASGTVYVADAGTGLFGHVYLVTAPVTTGGTRVDLGERASANTDAAAPSISGTNVAVPQSAFLSDDVTSVQYCTVGSCPTAGTFAVPAGYRYLGNGGDRAILVDTTTGALGLAPWNGAAFTPITLPAGFEATSASGDTAGVLLHGGGTAHYVRRSDSHVFETGIDANRAVLTPTFVAWYLVATGDSFDQTAVRVVARSNPEAPASTLAMLPGAPDFNTFAANDSGVAWLRPQDDGSNLLYTLPIAGGTPVLYPRPIDTTGLTTFEDDPAFLVNDRRAGIPGLYRVATGSTSGTLTGLLPVRTAITWSASLSNARAAYTDDMTEDRPAFLIDVPNGVPDYPSERTVSPTASSNVALSGPYVALGRHGTELAFGRTDGPLSSVPIPASDRGKVAISGRRALVSGGVNSRLVDVVTGAVTNLGHVYANLFGDYLVTLNYDTGRIERKNLATGSVQVVKAAPAGCAPGCVDEEWWALQPWGHEVAYAYRTRLGGLVQGLWNGGTAATEALPGLSLDGEGNPSYYEIRYWSGLLLVYTTDFTIDLYDVRNDTGPHVLAEQSDAPMDLDGHNVAWRRLSDLRVVVRPLTDVVPGHNASPRYLGGVIPKGFAPGTETDDWTPSFSVSQDVDWTLTIRAGSATGTVVRTLAGSSLYGEAAPVWDGTNASLADVPQGTYHWTLEGTGPGALPLLQASGSATPISGTVYVSRAALGAPVVNAPTRSTDTSATLTFTVAWSAPAGAPAGTTYTLQRSYNGSGYTTVASGIAALSRPYTAPAVGTYRFRVFATDPGGRNGAISAADTTMVPYDDTAGRLSGAWGSSSGALFYRGSQRRSTAAGSTISFTVTGTQIHLIGTKASTYGQFQVSVDGGAYSSLVSAYSASTQYRKVLWTRTGLASGSHTVKVRVYGTSGHPAVGIDGVASLR